MRAPGHTAAVAAALACAACGGGRDAQGLEAWLRIPGAQYVPGALPQASGGPAVLSAYASRSDVTPGRGDRALHASVGPSATGVAIGLSGDAGFWVLPAGAPDPQEPGALQVDAPLAFSTLLPVGAHALSVQAVGSDGVPGPAAVVALLAQAAQEPAAALSFTLTWESGADLDLHLVLPSGEELYWGHIAGGGGLLDFDSNQACVQDGLRRERVAWSAAPPPGRYLVRVDAPSLCGEPVASWRLAAEREGAVVSAVRGVALPSDTRGAHARGAGLLALDLDVR